MAEAQKQCRMVKNSLSKKMDKMTILQYSNPSGTSVSRKSAKMAELEKLNLEKFVYYAYPKLTHVGQNRASDNNGHLKTKGLAEIAFSSK